MVVSFNVSRLRFKYSVFKYPEDYINGRKERPEHSKEADAAIQRAYGLHTNDMENIYVFYTIGAFVRLVCACRVITDTASFLLRTGWHVVPQACSTP